MGFGLGAILLATPLVIQFEGERLGTYIDPVNIPTACIGETDPEITLRQRFTREECRTVLGASLYRHAVGVAECIDKPLKAHQAAAVLSWTYNVGVGAACKSTLVRKINQGAYASEWCPELKKWDKAGGRVLKGLTKRRVAEYQMCMGATP